MDLLCCLRFDTDENDQPVKSWLQSVVEYMCTRVSESAKYTANHK